MNAKTRFDPLLLQVLPHHLELEEHPEFVTDPLGEEAANHHRAYCININRVFINLDWCLRRTLPLLLPSSFPYQENLPK